VPFSFKAFPAKQNGLIMAPAQEQAVKHQRTRLASSIQTGHNPRREQMGSRVRPQLAFDIFVHQMSHAPTFEMGLRPRHRFHSADCSPLVFRFHTEVEVANG
jgi:hypothetical protein